MVGHGIFCTIASWALQGPHGPKVSHVYSVRSVRTRLVRGRWMTIAGSLQAMSVNGENGHDGDLSPCVFTG